MQVYEQLHCYESAHRTLAAQHIPRAPSGNPFAADAPWKREDLHRVGQDDCESLGGIFYFRILWFNVGPPLSACSSRWRPARYAVRTRVQRERKHTMSARHCKCTGLLQSSPEGPMLTSTVRYGWTW